MEKVMFASEKTDWETPPGLFNELNREFEFTCDVCATIENTKVPDCWIGEDIDALSTPWRGTCWINPPYGNQVGAWMRYAMQQAMMGNCEVVCLVPSRTDTRWWWDTSIHGEIRFIKGRLKFVGAESSAPFPSAIVVFRRFMQLGQGTVKWWNPETRSDW